MSLLEKKYPDGIPSSIMSKPIWDEFRMADELWCCKAVRQTMIKAPGFRFKAVLDDQVVRIRCEYCPRCGRKLSEGR